MDISHYRHRCRNMDHIALFHQQLFSFGAYCLNHRVCQQLLSIEPLYTLIQVDTRCDTIIVSLGDTQTKGTVVCQLTR